MKSTFKLLLTVMAISVLFTNCKKDNKDDGGTTDPNAVSGTFTVGSTTYNFKGAFGDKYGADSSYHQGFNIDMILYSDGINIVNVGGVPDSVYGQGAIIYLESFMPTENSFADGTYAYSDNVPHPLFTFSFFSDIGMGDYTTSNINFSSITGGTYTLSTLSDGRRNISFNLNLDGGGKITGTFSGPISYF